MLICSVWQSAHCFILSFVFFVRLSICLLVHLLILYLFVHLSVSLFVHLSVCLFYYQSFCLFVRLFVGAWKICEDPSPWFPEEMDKGRQMVDVVVADVADGKPGSWLKVKQVQTGFMTRPNDLIIFSQTRLYRFDWVDYDRNLLKLLHANFRLLIHQVFTLSKL